MAAVAGSSAAAGSSVNNTLSGNNMGSGGTGGITGLSINSQATGILSVPAVVSGTAISGIPRNTSVGIVRLRDVGRVEMGAAIISRP